MRIASPLHADLLFSAPRRREILPLEYSQRDDWRRPLVRGVGEAACECIFPEVSVLQVYGLTDTVGSMTVGPSDKKINTLGPAGWIVPGIMARVTKTDWKSGTRHGEQGGSIARTSTTALCYSNNEKSRVFVRRDFLSPADLCYSSLSQSCHLGTPPVPPFLGVILRSAQACVTASL